jgi:adenylate kinase
MLRRVALTGTPGTGKSTVALRLARRHSVVEVGDLALRLGAGENRSGGLVVDIDAVGRAFRHGRTVVPEQVVVGHLAHLLPVRDVVVLRCQPVSLLSRLRTARRGTPRDRTENAIAEAIGVITSEARSRRRNVLEVDTTRKTPAQVTREVERWIVGPRAPRWGSVDWLADRSVTEQLLEWAA